MMNLPQTYNEALTSEALAFAGDWIADHRKPNGVFHPDAEEIYGKALMKEWMQFYPSFGLDDIVYLAENGSQQAEQALREVAAEYEQRGERKPATLAAYNIRILNDRRMRKKPGPGKTALFVRDQGITLLVADLNKKFGLAFYKNFTATRGRPTASSIAATALTRAGIGISMGPMGVEKIWKRFGPIWTGRFPANYFGPYGAAVPQKSY
jgi:hypothetical protein